MPVIPIFTAHSKLRRILFRVAIASAVLFFLFVTFLFLIALVSGTTRKPISEQTALDSYRYYYTPINNKKIAFTFDDGPTARDTLDNMDALLANHAPATFFFIGEHVLAYPEVAQAVAQNGFTIGSHSFTHSYSIQDSERRLALELHSTEVVISSMTNTTPMFYRPPYLLGIGIDPAPNPYIPPDPANEWSLALGYFPVGTDIDTHDWLAKSPDQIFQNFKNELKAGRHIVLFHDVPHTAQALDEIIPWLHAQGYQIVSLQELLIPPSPIVLTHNLKLGDTDATTDTQVSLLQWFLSKEGDLDPYAVTGTFDQQTADGLALFQAKHGLIDPSAPDPARVSIADDTTRTAIALASQNAPAFGVPTSVLTPAARALERNYVFFLSYARRAIILLATLAVIFVFIRVGLFALLLLRPKTRKRERGFKPVDAMVTVIVPAYNEAENIRSTLESAMRIYYEKKEIIVVDDGSTDGTGDIAKVVMAEHPEANIALLQVENGGKARALTLAASKARGDILVVLDADAVLDKEAVSLMVRHFADPTIAAVAGKVYTTTQSTILDCFQALEYAVGQNIDKRAFSTLGAVGVVPGPAGAWRKDLVLAAGGFPLDTLVEDQDMTLTLLRMGYKIIYEPRAIAYTETPHNISNFLKQRFRWVYGTIQCFWKHKRVFIERPFHPMSYLVMPNTLIFGILLPITYPVVDTMLVISLFLGPVWEVLLPIAFFTLVDTAYAMWGLYGEKRSKKLLWFVPLQRILYRQLLYYTVIRSLVYAIEGRGSRWNKFAKLGETQRFFFNSLEEAPQPTPSPTFDATPLAIPK
jgi:cellulose synthase/poly-beta-1,6-N-acetylglucosamine synthase-like glycosyltransferase/peptidoglycan/xylan/chitin deacetylase (PgdA/CDA1 family)